MSRPTIFVLQNMPWEPQDKFTIRLCVSGINQGGALWLESEVDADSKEAAMELAKTAAEHLKNGVNFAP